jgi:two-component system OmpR family response regulator
LAASRPQSDRRHPRVLVVEDDAKLARLLARGLAEAGMPNDASLTGEDALALAGTYAYDAIVLDLMLPGMDGLEVFKALRERGVDAPVVILTARRDIDAYAEGVGVGPHDVFPKPFSLDELTARLRELIARSSSAH